MNQDERRRCEAMFRRHAVGVSRYVLLRVGSPELAEEITARVFLGVVRNIHQQNGSAAGWLWAIVRSELSRHFRERGRHALPADLADAATTADDDLERRERNQILRDALADLPDDEQQLLSLKFFLDFSNLEIAETLGMTPSNVGVKLHRTLKDLRKRLAVLCLE